MPLIATVRGTAVSEIIDYNPAPVPGPVVSRRSALEALYSSRVDLDRGRRGAMISSFSSA